MAKFDRPESLYFVGPRMPNGEPAEHLAGYGIAATDLHTGDPAYDRLTDEQVKQALDSGLYKTTKPRAGTAAKTADASQTDEPAKEG